MGKPQKSSTPKDSGLPPAIRPDKEVMEKFWSGVSRRARALPGPISWKIRHQPAKAPTKLFPMYLMKIDGRRKFLPFAEAVTAYTSGMADVSFGRYVLQEDFSVEKMTQADKTKISEATDRYEAAK